MVIHLKTSVNSTVRSLDFRQFDFSCTSHVLYADINLMTAAQKDFLLYSPSANFAIIEHTFQVLATKREFANLIPPKEEQRSMANYPNNMHCGNEQ
jgi:hypothetical protein